MKTDSKRGSKMLTGVVLAILALCGVVSAQTPTPIAAGHNNSATNSVVLTVTPAAGGHFLFVAGETTNNGQALSISDDRGQTWTVANSRVDGTGNSAQTWFTPSCLSGTTTITVTSVNSAGFIAGHWQEWSGLDPTSPLDKVASATGSSTTPSSGATATTTVPNEAVIGFVFKLSGSLSAGSGYTQADVFGGLLEYKTVTSVGAQTATWGLNPTGQWGAMVATFKAAPVGRRQPIVF